MILILHPDGRFLPLDATTRVSVSRGNIIAQHPMEEGAPTTDHAEPGNAQLVFSCRISETPLESAKEFAAYGDNVTHGHTGSDRIFWVESFLQSCLGELLTIVSTEGRFIYLDVMLAQYPFEWSISRAAPFTLSFTEVRIVRSEEARIPPKKVVPATITDEEKEAAEKAYVEDLDRSILEAGLFSGIPSQIP